MNRDTSTWEVPKYVKKEFADKKNDYCVCIPVINEGHRIQKQIQQIADFGVADKVDVIICDGGSTDGSLNESFLKEKGVNTLLTKQDTGKLSAQLRMGYSFALLRGYEGIVTIDGNGKDNVEAIVDMVTALKNGYDMVQGSRFVKGGKAVNTPFIRHIAVKLLHVPVISIAARFKYTDTTNGFRAYSVNYLLHPKVQPFRKIFDTYELLAYLSVRAPRLGLKIKEIPVTRVYPKKEKTPTKISFFKGNFSLIKILWGVLLRRYNPKTY